MAEFFLKKCCDENEKKINGFSEEALAAFQRYDWPGNLRELRNAVRRAALLTPCDAVIDVGVLLPEIIHNRNTEAGAQAETVLTEHPKEMLRDVAVRAEYQAIMAVLQKVNFNKKKAAELLKIDRKTLYNKLKLFQEQNDLNVV